MRKTIYSLAVITLLMLSAVACRSGDEEPPESEQTIMGINLLELIHVNTLEGIFWEGQVNLEECVYFSENIVQTVTSCDFITEAQKIVDANVQNNMRVSLYLQDNIIRGNLYLIIPHFNLAPNPYTITVSGGSEQSSDEDKTVVKMSQIESLSEPRDSLYRAGLLEGFSADQMKDKLSGTVKLNLTQQGITDSAVLTYSFNLERKL